MRLTWTVMAVIGAVACVTFSISSPYFLSVDNLINLLNDLALAGIVAIPATFLMMSGHVDLSVGACAAFTGIVLASTAPDSGLLTAVLLTVGTGLLIGLVNGLLVTIGGVDSIATTFAAMALLRGLAYLVPSGLAIAVPGLRSLGTSRPFLGLTLPTLIFGGAVVLAAVLSRSAGGGRTRGIGLLPAAGRLDGRAERRWVVGLFVVSGISAALIGLTRTSQLSTGLPTAAIGLEITVVTAVLLGGGRLAGGTGIGCRNSAGPVGDVCGRQRPLADQRHSLCGAGPARVFAGRGAGDRSTAAPGTGPMPRMFSAATASAPR